MSSEEYEVERIVDHKRAKKGSFKYLIKWLNYDDEDNTWERSDDVYAKDLIDNYWETVSNNHPDKAIYEKLSGKKTIKAKPLVIENDVETSEETNSSEETNTTAKLRDSPLEEKNETIEEKHNSTEEESESLNESEIALNESEIALNESEIALNESEIALDESRIALNEPDASKSTENSLGKQNLSDESRSTSKRARTESNGEEGRSIVKAKKIKLLVTGEDGSTNSLVESGSEGEVEHDDDIIFDDKFGQDKEDWQNSANKIEYIGREVEGSPLFCLLKWNDGVRSMHPLAVVRKKCPQLLIDAFVDVISQGK